ncbi:hypothetical protein [Thalassovita sp.]|uniref:carboxylate--amine ligase n=1 Tax=Thalassovita sp. TaxID=1979401 RepID=UPI0029DE744A|nr:hypothetical protein [Thalassovita sp.]
MLIPTSDQDIDLVIDNADRLSQHFRFQVSYADGLARQIMDKELFYNLCAAQNVAFPRLWSARKEQLPELASQITFPCMIKPSLIQLVKGQMKGRKGWIAQDSNDYLAQQALIPPGAGTLLVQEVVPGPESNITLWCGYLSEQEDQPQFTARKLRQYPPGFGSASLVQSQSEPETAQISRRMLTAMGYRGIAAAEFKIDPNTGQLKIIEVNTRPSLWFSVTDKAGSPIILQAYRHLAGLPPLPIAPQRDGVRWRYTSKDLYSSLFYRLSRFVLPAPNTSIVGPAHSRTFAVFALDDPLPAVAELLYFVRKALRRLIGGRRGR